MLFDSRDQAEVAPSTSKACTVCVEGLAGSGKSSIIKHAKYQLERIGVDARCHKLGGIGSSRRGRLLSAIRSTRQILFEQHIETTKQIRDRLSGRVYQLAARAQSREFLELVAASPAQVFLLERTPFMNSAHLLAEAINGDTSPSIYLGDAWYEELAEIESA
jgi:hypothetical protein